MRKWITILPNYLLFFLLAAAVQAEEAVEEAVEKKPPVMPELPLFEAHYQLSVLGLPFAQARRKLQKMTDTEYLFYTHAQTIGVLSWVRDDEITESTRWRVTDNRLQPLHYKFLHQGKRQKRREVRFDWQTMTAHSRKNEQSWELALETDTLDMLLSQLALTWELLQNPQPSDRSYVIAHNDEVKTYQIQFDGEEQLETELGRLQAFKFTRRDPDNEQRSSVLWVAPKLRYLPVRIEHTEPGDDTVKADIMSVEFVQP